ncbi:NADPH-dependent 2,4-dienoyl-CoA reductase/sulfur reductase-like enzyme [Paraburkholderia caballeronis]|uniref:FAD/NAD(P)-dependent oxidoreductase n=1 Tax=Paraburkholderia caballeronis TaxID=416943 RepID=UPI0010647DDB|nr:NAD(P)/FAD-dependent oxidoreductase [Paraburkholderia caballeronis]TDV38049.1 NADPH-dependent 2,4-dienoyl-CoA reductase/sulfur reductase-like enzyme [Paraburkholderia caballeronis]
MTPESFDVVVIGAGPAGMTAATAAAQAGLRVVLLDEQEAVGGQIYRSITRTDDKRLTLLGPDYAAGKDIASAFEASNVRHERGAQVWQVNADRTVEYLQKEQTKSVTGKQIVVATGAMERPFPIPGWSLPGVMTAGAAQILLKASGTIPRQPVVLAGCGPLLYLLAWQYLRAKVPIKALVETTTFSDKRRAAKHAVGALLGWKDLAKGVGLLRALRQARIPVYQGATDLRVEGVSAAEALSFTANNQSHRIDADLILLHQGVVPNTQVSWSIRAGHRWDDVQLCWVPKRTDVFELDVPDFFVVGDGGGISGAKAAATQGEICGLEITRRHGKIRDTEFFRLASKLRARLSQHLYIRPFLDSLYRPSDATRVPADNDVLVCRCEEVTAGEIRRSVALGCVGPNQIKAFNRCGMGPCQGRMCGLTVAEVIADERKVSPAEVGYYRIRPPIKPITLGQLAGIFHNND